MTEERLPVRVGELAVRVAPALLVTLGLGSCVAVILHDPKMRIGGLAHVLLPAPGPGGPGERGGRFAATAPNLLLREMRRLGATPGGVTARLAGGASMFTNLAAPGTIQVGERNVLAVREALRILSIPVTGESVGGGHGRNVEFDPATGRVIVTSYAHAPEQL